MHMNIDLIYFYRPYSTNFYLYGPQKVDSNIVVDSNGVLVFSSESAVFNKIDEMCASLSPEITNIYIKSSVEFTAGFKMRVYTGELNVSSDVPDYTQVLTNINNNLSNIGVKLSTSQNGNNQTGIATLISNIFQYSNGASSIKSGANSTDSMNSANLIKQLNRLISMFYFSDPDYYEQINSSQKLLRYIYQTFKQSVSPNANITDVISALNATIDSKQDTTIVNNEVTPLAEINIDVPFEVKNLKKSDVENL